MTVGSASHHRLTFPREARLLRRADFQRVYAHGRSRAHPAGVLFHAPSALGQDACARFGVTVSRRVARRAVDRNRLRRVWREAIRLTRARFRRGIDVVINARAARGKRLTTPEAQRILLELAAEEQLLGPEGSS